jgi:hypothetical protein
MMTSEKESIRYNPAGVRYSKKKKKKSNMGHQKVAPSIVNQFIEPSRFAEAQEHNR